MFVLRQSKEYCDKSNTPYDCLYTHIYIYLDKSVSKIEQVQMRQNEDYTEKHEKKTHDRQPNYILCVFSSDRAKRTIGKTVAFFQSHFIGNVPISNNANNKLHSCD